jgi:hypothetical protein
MPAQQTHTAANENDAAANTTSHAAGRSNPGQQRHVMRKDSLTQHSVREGAVRADDGQHRALDHVVRRRAGVAPGNREPGDMNATR